MNFYMTDFSGSRVASGLYQLTRRLGQGSCSTVYACKQLITGTEAAIKIEPVRKDPKLAVLPYEAAVYRQLRGGLGIPTAHWYGIDSGAYMLIMEPLGPTLDMLRRLCRGNFSLKTVLMLADQMLARVEFLHTRGIIYRDFKPGNFAMGLESRSNLVYLFDFGLSKLYRNPRSGEHIPYRENRDLIGTADFVSGNVHLGCEQSRRDDIEALGYVLLYLLRGRLPWQKIFAPSRDAKMTRLGEMKIGQALDPVLAELPPEFTEYFQHCRSLDFCDAPDYAYLKGLFRKIMVREGWNYDFRYDWIEGGIGKTLIPDEYRLRSAINDRT